MNSHATGSKFSVIPLAPVVVQQMCGNKMVWAYFGFWCRISIGLENPVFSGKPSVVCRTIVSFSIIVYNGFGTV